MAEQLYFTPNMNYYENSAVRDIPAEHIEEKKRRSPVQWILDLTGFSVNQLNVFFVRAFIIAFAVVFVAGAFYTMYLAAASENRARNQEKAYIEALAAYDDTRNKVKSKISDNDISDYAENTLHWVKMPERSGALSGGTQTNSFTK